MNENYLVWGCISKFVSQYKILDDNGNLTDDIESQEIVRRALMARIQFYFQNGLLKKDPYQSGTFVDQEYRRDDFTSEGIELIKSTDSKWLKSKSSRLNPPSCSILEKALISIRSGK